MTAVLGALRVLALREGSEIRKTMLTSSSRVRRAIPIRNRRRLWIPAQSGRIGAFHDRPADIRMPDVSLDGHRWWRRARLCSAGAVAHESVYSQ